MNYIKFVHDNITFYVQPKAKPELSIIAFEPPGSKVLYHASYQPPEIPGYRLIKPLRTAIWDQLQVEAEVDIIGICEQPPAPEYWRKKNMWDHLLRNSQIPETSEYTLELAWDLVDRGKLRISRSTPHYQSNQHMLFSIRTMNFTSAADNPMTCAKLFYDSGISNVMVQKYIENGFATDGVREISRINQFLQNKKTVYLVSESGEEIKVHTGDTLYASKFIKMTDGRLQIQDGHFQGKCDWLSSLEDIHHLRHGKQELTICTEALQSVEIGV